MKGNIITEDQMHPQKAKKEQNKSADELRRAKPQRAKIKPPKVSIIIPYPPELLINGCVGSVKKQTYKNIQLVLVEDKKGEGPGKSRNRGVNRAKGEILFFVDCDCTLERNCISKIVECFRKYKVDGVTGIPLSPKETSLFDRLTGLEYEDRFYQIGENFVDVAATTCFAVTKKSFKKMGGFNEKMVKKGYAVGEDWEFSTEFRKKGYKIWHTNKAKVYHYTATHVWKYFKKQFWHAFYRVVHFKKYKQATEQYATPRVISHGFLWILFPIIFLSSALFGFLLLLIIFWKIKMVLRIFGKTKEMKVFLLLPLTALRSLFWFLGAVVGVFKWF